MARPVVGNGPLGWGRRGGDAGVILVLWALALPALLGMLVLVVTAGATLLTVDNVQAAADSGAESGSAVLRAEPWALVTQAVTIPSGAHCRFDRDGGLTGCSQYSWLDGYYVYQPLGWYEIVGCRQGGCSPGPGQVTDTEAFADWSAGWDCRTWDGHGNGHGNGQGDGDCTMLGTGTASTTLGALGEGAAVDATQAVMGLVSRQYGVTARWGACTARPSGYFLPEAWAGVNCIGYKDDGSFWVEVVAPGPPAVAGVRVVGCVVRQSAAAGGYLTADPPFARASCP